MEVTDSTFVSAITPEDPDYIQDALNYGVDNPHGRHIIGIGTNSIDGVLVGDRDQLVRIATEILARLGA
ncbi:hypothetical protein K6T79_18215 [Mycolicibacter sp. MYC098]|uniref:Uncharacterized protein n=1 Tax=[Mycobacterium] crassicus TaxID=2872309 RepID=A0ABU5XL24_9MYCO|nr:hypothetical protein [Mycolicibacter sp. MYC098]